MLPKQIEYKQTTPVFPVTPLVETIAGYENIVASVVGLFQRAGISQYFT